MSSTANRVVKNTGFLYAKMSITMFISLYTTRLILNSLGASDFGIFNIVGGAISMLSFLNATMSSATQRFMSYSEGEGNKEKQKSIFNISLILHFVTSIIAGIILLIAGILFFNGLLDIPSTRIWAAQVVYASLIISTMFTVMTVPYEAIMNAHENMKYYAIVGVFESLLKLFVALACVYTVYDKLIVYGILMACIPLITLTIMRVYCHKHYSECTISPRKYWDKTIIKDMASFAGWNFMGSASSLIGNYGIGIVLNYFHGVTLNAAQGIANQLNGQFMAFSTNMLKALNPVIAKTEGAGNRHKMIQASSTGCKFSFYMLAFFAVPAIIEMPYLLKLWLKNVPEWAVVFTRLQLIRTLIEQSTIVFGSSLSAQGKIAQLNIINMIINFSPILLISQLFSMGYSPIMMYVVNISIFGIAAAGVKVFYMNKNCGMKYSFFFRTVLFPISFVFSIQLFISYIPTFYIKESFIRLLIICVISSTSFLVLFWSLGITSQEKNSIKAIIHILYNKFIKTLFPKFQKEALP